MSLAGQPSRQAGHDGEFFIGGSTVFIPFPERGLVLAVMTNTSFGDMWALALEIARACADPGRSPAPTQAAAARR